MDRISVIGLGYVGLPVVLAFGEKYPLVAFDVNEKRVSDLKNGIDGNGEAPKAALNLPNVNFTTDPNSLKQANFHIVAVPTPIDNAKVPDLSFVKQAAALLAPHLASGDTVVFESTVYPGATEQECLPILEKGSGLKSPDDFTIGYSPERINPGDHQRSFSQITKVVSANSEAALSRLAKLYGSVVDAGVHCAPSIQVAEAAKVIENTQRDLNIALMNELAIVFQTMGLDTKAVLEAASTKWNFLNFKPGLVGGHCIGVDPYYLTHKAKQLGYRPEVILAGRRINDKMGKYIASQMIKVLCQHKYNLQTTKVGVLGLTFKENCQDLRNTKVVDLVNELQEYGVEVLVHDPIADEQDAKALYNISLAKWEALGDVDALAVSVSHRAYQELTPNSIPNNLDKQRILFDIKHLYDEQPWHKANWSVWRL